MAKVYWANVYLLKSNKTYRGAMRTTRKEAVSKTNKCLKLHCRVKITMKENATATA